MCVLCSQQAVLSDSFCARKEEILAKIETRTDWYLSLLCVILQQ